MGKRALKLDTPNNIRKALSKIANMVYRGEIDGKQANTFVYVCNALLGSIRVDEQEKKIQELEEYINALEENKKS